MMFSRLESDARPGNSSRGGGRVHMVAKLRKASIQLSAAGIESPPCFRSPGPENRYPDDAARLGDDSRAAAWSASQANPAGGFVPGVPLGCLGMGDGIGFWVPGPCMVAAGQKAEAA